MKNLMVIAAGGIAMMSVAANGAAATCSVKIEGKSYVADITKGKRSYLKCTACHTLGPGEKNRVGPNLGKMFDRPALSAPDYAYSAAFKKKAPKWNDDNLDAFLVKPAKYIPGNKMIFAGLTAPQERANMIAYLRSATGSRGC